VVHKTGAGHIESKLNEIENKTERAISDITNQGDRQRRISELFSRGLDAIKSNQYKEAADSFQKVVELDFEYEAAQSNLGVALSGLGKIKRDENLINSAIEKYKKTIELKPDHCDAFNNCGTALYRLGSISGDEKFFLEAY
jgi:Tfp pilus assembly protein PilF